MNVGSFPFMIDSVQWLSSTIKDNREINVKISSDSPEVKMIMAINCRNHDTSIDESVYTEAAGSLFAFPRYTKSNAASYYTLFEYVSVFGDKFKDPSSIMLSSYKSMLGVDLDSIPYIHPENVYVCRDDIRSYDSCVYAAVYSGLYRHIWGALFRNLSSYGANTILNTYKDNISDIQLERILNARINGVEIEDDLPEDDTI